MKNRLFVKITLMALTSLSTMCTGVVSPALPLIQKSLEEAGATDIGMVVKMMVVVPNLFIAMFSPVFGFLSPKIGKLRLLFFALLLYAFAGTSGFFLPTIYHIIAMRIVLGISIAAVLTVVTTLIADYFDGPERSSLVSMQTVFMSIGSTVYGFLAGVLADIGWRNIFFLYAMALLYFPFAVKFLFNPDARQPDEDRVKTNRKIVQNNVAILLVCCVNFFVMVMFYMIKIQLPYMLYNDPQINFVNIPSFAGGAFHFVRVAVNAKLVSICLSCEVIITTLISMRYVVFKKNRDFAVMCAMGLAFMAISYILLTFSVNYWMILISMGVCGVGMGMLMPNSTLWVISITKPEKRPLFVGIFNTSSYGGKFCSPFIAAVFFYFIPKDNPRMLFEICAFLMLIVAVTAMWMNDRFKRVNRILYRKELIELREKTKQS